MISQPPRKRILHVFGCMNRGGAEMRTLDLFRRLDRTRFQFDFCCLSGQPGELDEEIRALGGRVHLCRLGLSFASRFRQLLGAEGYAVVHSHVHLFSGFILRLARQCNVPCRIAHFRVTTSNHPRTWRRRVQETVMRHWIRRHATHILGVGEGALREGWDRGWPADPRCAVIHNGLDVASFSVPADPLAVRREFGLPDDCPLVIHVGRMDPQKNHVRLIAIASRLLRQEVRLRCLLVGRENPETKRQLVARLAEEGLLDRVVFAGIREDVPRLLQAADLLLFPSLFEGLPGVVLEACAAGLPVLGSDLPGVCEIAAHFPLVRHLPLAADDAQWVRFAQEMLATPSSRSVPSRASAWEAFAASPFSLQRCLRELCHIWDGTVASTQRDA